MAASIDNAFRTLLKEFRRIGIILAVMLVLFLYLSPHQSGPLLVESSRSKPETKEKRERAKTLPVVAAPAIQTPQSHPLPQGPGFDDALEQYKAENWAESEEILRENLKQNPNDDRSLVLLAKIQRDKDPGSLEASDLLLRALKVNPRSGDAADELYYSLMHRHSLEGGLKQIAEFRKDVPSSTQGALSYLEGRLYLSSGNPDAARASLETAWGEGIDTDAVREQLAEAYSDLHRDNDAERLWNELSVADVPSQMSLKAKIRSAEILYKKGEVDKARELLQETLELDPSNPYALDFSSHLSQ